MVVHNCSFEHAATSAPEALAGRKNDVSIAIIIQAVKGMGLSSIPVSCSLSSQVCRCRRETCRLPLRTPKLV